MWWWLCVVLTLQCPLKNECLNEWCVIPTGFFKFDWRDTYVQVKSITKDANGSYTVQREANTPPQYPWQSGCRFYAVDSLELLDHPGEFFVDNTTAQLFFIPPNGPLSPSDEVYVSVLNSIVQVKGASHVAFMNLDISVSQGDVVTSPAWGQFCCL